MNRVNKYRVWYNSHGSTGEFITKRRQTFITASATAEFIAKRTRKPRENIHKAGAYFHTVQIGNDKGWTEYPIEHDHRSDVIVQRLIEAKEMHLSFYDDGEGAEFL